MISSHDLCKSNVCDWAIAEMFPSKLNRLFKKFFGWSAEDGTCWVSIGFGPRFILGDLPNIVGLYDSAGQSGYPRNVVNLEQTMDVTNDEDVRTLVESARDDTLSEHHRRDSVSNCESSASTYRAYERLEVSVRGLLSRVNGVASRSRATFPFVEVSFEREAAYSVFIVSIVICSRFH